MQVRDLFVTNAHRIAHGMVKGQNENLINK